MSPIHLCRRPALRFAFLLSLSPSSGSYHDLHGVDKPCSVSDPIGSTELWYETHKQVTIKRAGLCDPAPLEMINASWPRKKSGPEFGAMIVVKERNQTPVRRREETIGC